SSGLLNLKASTVRDNHVETGPWGTGGGIFIYAGAGHILDVVDSTISGNVADGVGGLYILGSNANSPASGTLVNSTISDNTAAFIGGIRVGLNGIHLDFINCTITNNTTGNGGVGGGLDITWGATAKLTNTIVAENHGGNGPNIYTPALG